jgi:hypothetical protein
MKSWSIVVKQMKIDRTKVTSKVGYHSIANMVGYLFDKHHRNHIDTKFHKLHNNQSRFLNTLITEHQAYTEKKKALTGHKAKGRLISNIATSITINLPRDIESGEPTREHWDKILNSVFGTLADQYGVSVDDVKARSVAVWHQEIDNDKPFHIHLMVSNIFNGQVVKHLNYKRGILGDIKTKFSDAVDRVLGISYRTYKPINEGLKNVAIWKAQRDKRREAQKAINTALNDVTDEFLKLEAEIGANRKIKKWFQKLDKLLFETYSHKPSSPEFEKSKKQLDKFEAMIERKKGDLNLTEDQQEKFDARLWAIKFQGLSYGMNRAPKPKLS